MPLENLVYSAKALVLWVLLATALGGVPFAVSPGQFTFGIVWVCSMLGLIGGVAHGIVALALPHLKRTVLSMGGATAFTSSVFALGLSYLITGLGYLDVSALLQREVLIGALAITFGMSVLATAVTFLLRTAGAA